MRMIERWFPCAEVSEASAGGWGSGKSEKALFTWFAARPLAQAKAAVLTSLLPWPEDEAEQARLQKLVRDAMMGRDAKHAELVAELAKAYPDGASLLDLFSGRAMIPLEAARLGVEAHGVDYSPVATLAGQLLADFPLRDWSGEPPLPFASEGTIDVSGSRLLDDVRAVLDEVGRRYAMAMARRLPPGPRPSALGIPVGCHPAVRGVRKPVPAHRLPGPPAPAAGQERSRAELPHRGRPRRRHVPHRHPRGATERPADTDRHDERW